MRKRELLAIDDLAEGELYHVAWAHPAWRTGDEPMRCEEQLTFVGLDARGRGSMATVWQIAGGVLSEIPSTWIAELRRAS